MGMVVIVGVTVPLYNCAFVSLGLVMNVFGVIFFNFFFYIFFVTNLTLSMSDKLQMVNYPRSAIDTLPSQACQSLFLS